MAEFSREAKRDSGSTVMERVRRHRGLAVGMIAGTAIAVGGVSTGAFETSRAEADCSGVCEGVDPNAPPDYQQYFPETTPQELLPRRDPNCTPAADSAKPKLKVTNARYATRFHDKSDISSTGEGVVYRNILTLSVPNKDMTVSVNSYLPGSHGKLRRYTERRELKACEVVAGRSTQRVVSDGQERRPIRRDQRNLLTVTTHQGKKRISLFRHNYPLRGNATHSKFDKTGKYDTEVLNR